jgi:hypothetical protein
VTRAFLQSGISARRTALRAGFCLALLLSACGDPGIDRNLRRTVDGLQDAALEGDTAWRLLDSLTTEVGPRMAGTEGDAQAVAWARRAMNDLGFDRVWLEHVSFPLWYRRGESARIVGPQPGTLDITALGGSPSTGGALEAEVVHFENLEALESADPDMVAGKIAFVAERMIKSRDGSGYGKAVQQRSKGPFVAARKGAAALLIRSVGTGDDAPHTGMISNSEEGDPVPSAALSNRDSDRLVELLEGGEAVRVLLELDCGFDGLGTSQNVIGEFRGSGETDRFVVIGAHLDSWDLGTGAVDDGAGVAITLAAARLVADLPERPRRGIRVVLFANEEQGIHGGKAYAEAHRAEIYQHALGAESDLGSGRIYQFRSRALPEAQAAIEQLATLLEPLGVPWVEDGPASGGADLGQMRKLGMPVLDFNQDASRYFDLHHTRNDVLEHVEAADLRFNVAVYASFIYWAASTDTRFGPVDPST